MQKADTPASAPPADTGFDLKGEVAPPAADPGFKVPPEDDAPSAPTAVKGAKRIDVAPVAEAPVEDTSTRDLAIGAGVFVVLLLVFFFIRNAYVQHLVVKRVAPSTAGSAGWLLFLGLGFVSLAAVLAMINPSRFMSAAIGVPVLLAGLAALVAAVVVGRR